MWPWLVAVSFLVVYSQLLEKFSGNETIKTHLPSGALHTDWARRQILLFVLRIGSFPYGKEPGGERYGSSKFALAFFSCACGSAMSSR